MRKSLSSVADLGAGEKYYLYYSNTKSSFSHKVTAAYSFGFNGMEKDDEVSGSGDAYATEFRELDPRLGRWFSVDPEITADQSPYVSMNNNPFLNDDPDGDVVRFESHKAFWKAIFQAVGDKNIRQSLWKQEFDKSVSSPENRTV